MYTSVVISVTLLWVDSWLDCPSLVVSIHTVQSSKFASQTSQFLCLLVCVQLWEDMRIRLIQVCMKNVLGNYFAAEKQHQARVRSMITE